MHRRRKVYRAMSALMRCGKCAPNTDRIPCSQCRAAMLRWHDGVPVGRWRGNAPRGRRTMSPGVRNRTHRVGNWVSVCARRQRIPWRFSAVQVNEAKCVRVQFPRRNMVVNVRYALFKLAERISISSIILWDAMTFRTFRCVVWVPLQKESKVRCGCSFMASDYGVLSVVETTAKCFRRRRPFECGIRVRHSTDVRIQF